MSSTKSNTKSLLDISVLSTDDTSCFSEDSQPRICFDEYCTFPMGDMCEACNLDRQVRKKRITRSEKVQLAKEWVEEINVQKYITNYSGEEFVGAADEKDAMDKEEKEVEAPEVGDDYEGDGEDSSDEMELRNDLDSPNRPNFSGLIPTSFTSEWITHQNASSILEETFPSTSQPSILPVDSNSDTRLESWISDIFDRTLNGQMEDTVFIGGAEDDPRQERCPLCGNPVGDPTDQHLIQCQFAHDEQKRWKHH